MKASSLFSIMASLASMDTSFHGKRGDISNRNPVNPHNFPSFTTEGFTTHSINQAAHDAKYAKYLKKKSK